MVNARRFVLFCVLAAAGLVFGGEARLTLPPMASAPSEDVFNAAEWTGAAHFPRFYRHESGGVAESRRAECWVGATETAFYFAISSELPPVGGLLNEPGNQVDVGSSDVCEFFISAEAGAEKGINYQLLVAPDGRLTGLAHERGGAHAEENWESRVKVKSVQRDGSWIVTGKVDLGLFHRPLLGTTWGFSCCRDWKNPWRFSCAPADFMGRDVRLTFDKTAPACGFTFAVPPHDQKTIKGTLSLANLSGAAAEYDVDLVTTTDAMPKMELARRVAVAAGAVKTVDYEAPNLFNSTEYKTVLKVTPAGAARPTYEVPYLWKAPFDAPIWTVSAAEIKPFDFEFAYYPTKNVLRLAQSLNVAADKAPASIGYAIAEKKSGKVIKRVEFPARDGHEDLIRLPPLDGDYTITLTVGETKTVKEFERHRFAWEGNTLGKSRTVYPPFKPIRVKDAKEPELEVVLRRHRLGGTGLPQSIVAKDREILAGGFRLMANGEEASGVLRVGEKADDRVVTSSQITGANGFEAVSRGIWEVDGCLRYELTLAKGKVDSLVLEVPLKDESAKLIHALGRMRDSVSKELPAGDGKIWDARKVRQLLCDGFAPYVLLSNAHRGLAFWAENDKGWSWDRATSNVEIWRTGETVTMKIFLVNKPIVIEKPRKIVLGFMAAPVKPRPADWLTRREDWNVAFLATDIQWFAEGDCGSVAPVGKNLAFWDWIRKCYDAKEPVPDLADAEPLIVFLDETMKIYPNYEGWRKPFYRNMFRHHRDQGSSKTVGRPVTPLLYYNRSVWNNLEEYKTFMNEWSLRDFPARGTPPNMGEIMIVPSEGTYLDYVVWWYKKSFAYGNRGVYCDNYFNVLTYNRAYPAVYKDADGTTVPANVIWALRDQAKRVRQMMCEAGMTPFFWPHMTSTMILPTLSFADGQLDWEWKYGEGPVQTRFSEAYLQHATSGELQGVVPWVLWDQHGSSGEECVKRSFSGVMMLYGLGSQNGSYPEFREKIRAPYLKNPKTVFENFLTEGRQNVAVASKDVRWSLLSVPGERATLVAVNWTERPFETTATVDLKALGLEGATCRNFDTGAEVKVETGGRLFLPLSGWGVTVYELTKGGR